MSKKIYIVSSTPRKNGNSQILADEFVRGAKEAGHTVISINIRELNLQFCIGCLYCQSHDKCVLNDSMNSLYSDIQSADALVFATPIYYYEMSGQLKTFLDRLNPLFPRENNFKDVYLLASAADSEESAMDGAVKGIQGWIDCFDGVRLAGVIRGINANDAGTIRNTPAPEQAYLLGKSL